MDKNLLFDGTSIGKMELCVNRKRAATCGGSSVSY